MRLVERLTRVDADTLRHEFTVTDPETWSSPWTASVPLVLNTEPMIEYACHEGNDSMPVMLGGTRAEEKAAGPRDEAYAHARPSLGRRALSGVLFGASISRGGFR